MLGDDSGGDGGVGGDDGDDGGDDGDDGGDGGDPILQRVSTLVKEYTDL